MIPIITTKRKVLVDANHYFNISEYDFNHEEWIDVTDRFKISDDVLITCMFINKNILDMIHNNILVKGVTV